MVPDTFAELSIGSKEWRPDRYHNMGIYISSFGGFAALSTRCGISAPGRSAGNVSLMFPAGGIWNRIVWARRRHMEEDAFHVTRAEAAAAAWLQAEKYDPVLEGDLLPGPRSAMEQPALMNYGKPWRQDQTVIQVVDTTGFKVGQDISIGGQPHQITKIQDDSFWVAAYR